MASRTAAARRSKPTRASGTLSFEQSSRPSAKEETARTGVAVKYGKHFSADLLRAIPGAGDAAVEQMREGMVPEPGHIRLTLHILRGVNIAAGWRTHVAASVGRAKGRTKSAHSCCCTRSPVWDDNIILSLTAAQVAEGTVVLKVQSGCTVRAFCKLKVRDMFIGSTGDVEWFAPLKGAFSWTPCGLCGGPGEIALTAHMSPQAAKIASGRVTVSEADAGHIVRPDEIGGSEEACVNSSEAEEL